MNAKKKKIVYVCKVLPAFLFTVTMARDFFWKMLSNSTVLSRNRKDCSPLIVLPIPTRPPNYYYITYTKIIHRTSNM